MPRRLVLRAILVAAAAAAAVAAWQVGPEELRDLAARARGSGVRGVAIFFAVYILCTVALIPGSLLTLAAGFAYGPVWGLALASPASVAGASCALLLGRTLLRDAVARRTAGWPRARAIDRAVARQGFKIVLLLRLSPLIPFNLLNYALSVTRVRLDAYAAASLLGMLPVTALYVYAGSLAALGTGLEEAPDAGPARIAIYGAGLLATAAAVLLVTRAARKELERELGGAG